MTTYGEITRDYIKYKLEPIYPKNNAPTEEQIRIVYEVLNNPILLGAYRCDVKKDEKKENSINKAREKIVNLLDEVFMGGMEYELCLKFPAPVTHEEYRDMRKPIKLTRQTDVLRNFKEQEGPKFETKLKDAGIPANIIRDTILPAVWRRYKTKTDNPL